jgi:hypothetical protein
MCYQWSTWGICREQVSETCQCIAVSAFTGEIGDGKIFVLPVADIIRMCVLSHQVLTYNVAGQFVCPGFLSPRCNQVSDTFCYTTECLYVCVLSTAAKISIVTISSQSGCYE